MYDVLVDGSWLWRASIQDLIDSVKWRICVFQNFERNQGIPTTLFIILARRLLIDFHHKGLGYCFQITSFLCTVKSYVFCHN